MLLLLACGPDTALLDVHLRVHVESSADAAQNPRGVPRTAWLADPEGYEERLVQFLAWEEEVVARGARLDFMADGEFWAASRQHTATWARHGDEGLAVWLRARGHGTYAHTHDNYADTMYALELALGEPPPPVVGGFMIDQYGELLRGVTSTDGEHTYAFSIFTGAASVGHQDDDASCGIWRPSSETRFTTHDPAGPVVYVGGGLDTLPAALVLADHSYAWSTVAVMVDYEDLHGADDTAPEAILDGLDTLRETGPVRFVDVETSVGDYARLGEGNRWWGCG